MVTNSPSLRSGLGRSGYGSTRTGSPGALSPGSFNSGSGRRTGFAANTNGAPTNSGRGGTGIGRLNRSTGIGLGVAAVGALYYYLQGGEGLDWVPIQGGWEVPGGVSGVLPEDHVSGHHLEQTFVRRADGNYNHSLLYDDYHLWQYVYQSVIDVRPPPPYAAIEYGFSYWIPPGNTPSEVTRPQWAAPGVGPAPGRSPQPGPPPWQWPGTHAPPSSPPRPRAPKNQRPRIKRGPGTRVEVSFTPNSTTIGVVTGTSRPRDGSPERKVRSAVTALLVWILNIGTETMDLLDILYEAAGISTNDVGWRAATEEFFLNGGHERVDMTAFGDILANQAEDRLYGEFFQDVQTAYNNLGQSTTTVFGI